MFILLMQWDTVVPIPGVADSLECVGWDGPGLVEGCLCVVGFSSCIFVEGLEVYCASRFSRLFGYNHHSVTPGYRGSDWDRLNNT